MELILLLGMLLVLLALGVPVAFALAGASLATFLYMDIPLIVGFQRMTSGINTFALMAIPFFVFAGELMYRAGIAQRLVTVADALFGRSRGGLGQVTIGASMMFGAVSGSAVASVSAIGSALMPMMKERGYDGDYAVNVTVTSAVLGILIPPSVTMIVYGISTETSIGRLFIAGLLPGLMLTCLFMAWSLFAAWRGGYRFSLTGAGYSLRQKLVVLPRVLPFLLIIAGVLYVLYGGIATPSEAAGVGALFCVLLVVVIYGLFLRSWSPTRIWEILGDSMRESVMILMIIGASALFSYTLSSLFVTQSIAEWIAGLDVNKWVLMAMINAFLLVCGFFLPPVAVILMTAPILLPIVTSAGFDPYWFAVVFTINMEIGLITPPVGLNLYVINGIAPDVSLPTILKGALPFMLSMALGIVLLCIFPEIATWLPEAIMGPGF